MVPSERDGNCLYTSVLASVHALYNVLPDEFKRHLRELNIDIDSTSDPATIERVRQVVTDLLASNQEEYFSFLCSDQVSPKDYNAVVRDFKS